jgi:hypothetical protein
MHLLGLLLLSGKVSATLRSSEDALNCWPACQLVFPSNHQMGHCIRYSHASICVVMVMLHQLRLARLFRAINSRSAKSQPRQRSRIAGEKHNKHHHHQCCEQETREQCCKTSRSDSGKTGRIWCDIIIVSGNSGDDDGRESSLQVAGDGVAPFVTERQD